MGIRTAFREALGLTAPANLVTFSNVFPTATGILSPWSTSQLNEFVWSDILGSDQPTPVTRAEAMSLPAVVNGRARILALAGKQLVALDKAGPLADQPTWLYRTDTAVPCWFRIANTLDDWIFSGHSLWIVERGAGDQIIDALHLPLDRWEISPAGEILVAASPGAVKLPVAPGAVLYLPGPFEGLLNAGKATIRAAKDLERTWAGKARNPIPAIVLTEKEDNGMTAEEAGPYVTAVAKARRDPDGAVMFVPFGIAVSFEGTAEPAFAIEARNAVKIDIASFLNLPAEAIEAAQPKASLNYETAATTATEVADRMSYWSEPFEARLSMDDVCARGQRIRFDFSSTPTAPGNDTGPFAED